MSRTQSMGEILDQAKKVKPIAEKDGAKMVSYEDAVTLQQAEVIDGFDFGDRELNPDGSIAKSRTTILAVNPERRTANSYRIVEEGERKLLQVVDDYRAVQEQPTGKVYLAQVPANEFERIDGKLTFIRQINIPRQEFISEFTGTLNVEAMYEVLGAVEAHDEEKGVDAMPI